MNQQIIRRAYILQVSPSNFVLNEHGRFGVLDKEGVIYRDSYFKLGPFGSKHE